MLLLTIVKAPEGTLTAGPDCPFEAADRPASSTSSDIPNLKQL
jgi:hypothetical protein